MVAIVLCCTNSSLAGSASQMDSTVNPLADPSVNLLADVEGGTLEDAHVRIAALEASLEQRFAGRPDVNIQPPQTSRQA